MGEIKWDSVADENLAYAIIYGDSPLSPEDIIPASRLIEAGLMKAEESHDGIILKATELGVRDALKRGLVLKNEGNRPPYLENPDRPFWRDGSGAPRG